MYDALLYNSRIATERSTILKQLRLQPKSYLLATVHRAENTDDVARLQNIVQAFTTLSALHPRVWPVHPRTRHVLQSRGLLKTSNHTLLLIALVSYLDMLLLEKEAKGILTDSGGVQKEAFWFRVPCVTLREETEWVETVEAGWNTLVGTDVEDIVAAVLGQVPLQGDPPLYGDGYASRKIVSTLVAALQNTM